MPNKHVQGNFSQKGILFLNFTTQMLLFSVKIVVTHRKNKRAVPIKASTFLVLMKQYGSKCERAI